MNTSEETATDCGGGNRNTKALFTTIALGAVGVAAGFGAYRLIKTSNAGAGKREDSIREWLTQQMTRLQSGLGLTDEQIEWLAAEIRPVIKLGNKLYRKAEDLAPAVLEKTLLAVEKEMLKAKTRIQKMLELSEAAHLTALHLFYEELRMIVLGLVTELEATGSRSRTEPIADEAVIAS